MEKLFLLGGVGILAGYLAAKMRKMGGHPAAKGLSSKVVKGGWKITRLEESRVEGELVMLNQPAIARKNGLRDTVNFGSAWRGTVALTLAFCMSGVVQAGQEQQQSQQQGQQQDQQQGQGQGQQEQQSQQQDATQPAPKPKPVYPPQDADKPPYARDRSMQNAPGAPNSAGQNNPNPQGAPPPPADQNNPYPPQSNPSGQGERRGLAGRAAQYAQPVPPTLTVPPGTIIVIRTDGFLSSDKNKAGDVFTGVLDQPIVVNGWVVARRGQVVTGKVKEAVKAGKVKGVSQLGVELTDFTVVDGEQVPVLTELWKGSGGTTHGLDAGTIASTTAVGAGIGAAFGWGVGAAIGAGAGAVAGITTVLLTRGRPTILTPETQLSFRLVDPVKIDTTQGQQAFFPVSQEDYDGGRMQRRGAPRVAGGYPSQYPCGPYAPCYGYPGYAYPGYFYPGAVVGVYGGARYYGGYYGGYRGGYYGRPGYHY